MNTNKLIKNFYNYIKGFIEIVHTQTPRYSFVIEKLDITYQNITMKTKIDYTPVGCYRLFRNFASELNDEIVCRKFKPNHARMIIGIDLLEKTLDFNKQEQTQIYLNFIKACIDSLKD